MTATTRTHTHGPWTIDRDRAIACWTASGIRQGAVAEVLSWMGTEEADANARLIASAPALLAALKEARAWMARGRPIDHGAKCGTWSEADDMVERAIAEAEGRA